MGLSGRALAQGSIAAGQISGQPIGGGVYHYDIVLSNISQDPVGSFWFAWVPDKDFLPSIPMNIQSPTDWVHILSGGPGPTPNGYSISFYANPHEASMQPGDVLTFGFDSIDSPATLAGNSPFYPSYPILTSTAYGGAPLSGPGFEFVLEGVPEPASTTMFALGLAALVMLKRRKR